MSVSVVWRCRSALRMLASVQATHFLAGLLTSRERWQTRTNPNRNPLVRYYPLSSLFSHGKSLIAANAASVGNQCTQGRIYSKIYILLLKTASYQEVISYPPSLSAGGSSPASAGGNPPCGAHGACRST